MKNDIIFPNENDNKGLSVTNVELGQSFVSKSLIKNPLLIEFINFSHRQNEKQQQAIAHQVKKRLRNLRIYVAILVVLIAVAISFALYANISKKEAVFAKNDALKSQSSLLLKSVEEENKNHNYDTGILLGLNALAGLYGGDRPLVDDISAFLKSVLFSNKIFHFDKKLYNINLMDKQGKVLIEYNRYEKVVKLFDIATGDFKFDFQHDENVVYVTISEDAQRVASIDEKGNIHIWSITGIHLSKIKTNILPDVKEPKTFYVGKFVKNNILIFSPDAKKVAIRVPSSSNTSFIVYQIDTGEVIYKAKYEKEVYLHSFAWHPDSNKVISVISLAREAKELDKLEIHNLDKKEAYGFEWREIWSSSEHDYFFSPNGKFLAIGNKIWNMEVHKLELVLTRYSLPLLFLSDDELFYQDKDETVRRINTEGEVSALWPEANIKKLFFDKQENIYIGYSNDNKIKRFSLGQGEINSQKVEQKLIWPNSYPRITYRDKSLFVLGETGLFKFSLLYKKNSPFYLTEKSNIYYNIESDFDFISFSGHPAWPPSPSVGYLNSTKNMISTSHTNVSHPYGFSNLDGSVMADRKYTNRLDIYKIDTKGAPYKYASNAFARGGKYLYKYDDILSKSLISTIDENLDKYKFNDQGSLLFDLNHNNKLSIYNVYTGKLIKELYPSGNFDLIDNFYVKNSLIILNELNAGGDNAIVVWKDHTQESPLLKFTNHHIDNKTDANFAMWKVSDDESLLLVSFEPYRLEVYSLLTGNLITQHYFDSKIIEIDINAKNDVLVSLKSGSILSKNVNDNNFTRWYNHKYTTAKFLGKGMVKLTTEYAQNKQVIIPFLAPKALVDIAIQKLPINRKCLSDIEKESFGLLKLTLNQKQILGCSN